MTRAGGERGVFLYGAIPKRAGALLLAGCLFAAISSADPQAPPDLTILSLEDLMSVEVTSVARRQQKLSETASAVYVISQEDIRRSGATTIPEALRMAPGVHVARASGNKWAVSIRGFNNLFSDKLLVMIDGRSIYTPLFAGVIWEMQDLILEDIERIEVVRGPGGTMWGSNAVNGVISIITKHSADTQGGVVSANVGNQEGAGGHLRYGAKAGDNLHYRFYSKTFDRRGNFDLAGNRAPDEWDSLRGGFRADWSPSSRDELSFSGESSSTNADALNTVPVERFPYMATVRADGSSSAAHAMAHWKRRQSERSQSTLRVYFDHYQRNEPTASDRVNTVDIDFQNETEITSRNRVVWGMGYRRYDDEFQPNRLVRFDPATRTTHLWNLFAQDEIWLKPDRLLLSVGLKTEHNSYTQNELQPHGSLLWLPGERTSLWASVSRAVRIPFRANHDLKANYGSFPGPGNLQTAVFVLGNRDFHAEELVAYQTGARREISADLSIDLTGFVHDYNRIQSTEIGQPYFDPDLLPGALIIPQVFGNDIHGTAYGAEAAVHWRPWQSSRLNVSYSWLQTPVRTRPGSSASVNSIREQTPDHLLHARWYQDLSRKAQVDFAYYFADETFQGDHPSLHRFDARLGWALRGNLQLSIGAQNLLDPKHSEVPTLGFAESGQIGRSIYGSLRWAF